MIYFIYQSYVPNTAISNRALAYLRSLEQLKVRVSVLFLLPDDSRSRIEDVFDYVHIEYCWERYYINNKYLKYVCYYNYLKSIKKRLKKGDKVYVYGSNDILHFLIDKPEVELFFEITEHPEVYLSKSRLYSPTVSEHIELCKRIAGLIVISSQLKDYYIKMGIDPSRVHIVNMIVDPSRFDNLTKQNTGERYIAYCGTVSNNKDGVDILLRAFALVTNTHPGLKLYVIGNIPTEQEKSDNMALVHELRINDQVVLTGCIPASKMPQMLKNAEALVLARPDNKQAKYGFPTKLGEYLLTENPVVLTSVGDIPIYLKDKATALIVPPYHSEQFAYAINWVLDHPKEARLIGKEGKKVALESFNAERETKKLMRIMDNRY